MAIYINGRRVGFRIPVTSASVVQPTVALEKTITGDFANTVEWGTETSNIMVLSRSGNHVIQSEILDQYYYLVVEYSGKQYILGCSSDGIEIQQYDPLNADYISDISSEYAWRGYSGNHPQLSNVETGKYILVDESGAIVVSDSEPNGWFGIQNNYLCYSNSIAENWGPIYAGNLIRIRQGEFTENNIPLTAFIYAGDYQKISGSGSRTKWNVTLTPVSDTQGTLDGANRMLILTREDTGDHFLYNCNVYDPSFGYYQVNPTYDSNGEPTSFSFTYTGQESNLKRYFLTVTGEQGHYAVQFSNGMYLNPPPTDAYHHSTLDEYVLSNTSGEILYNDGRGVYLSGGVDLGPFGISSVTIGFPMTSHAAGDTAGGSTVLYHWDGSTWQECQTAPEPGETYAMVIRKYDADVPDDPNAHYFLVTYNGSALSGVDLGTEKELIPSKITSDGKFVWDDGQIRYGFEYLTGTNALSLAKTKPYNSWLYVVNEDPALNRMWMCSNVQRKMYAIYANNKKL